jgi:hypothetical protein
MGWGCGFVPGWWRLGMSCEHGKWFGAWNAKASKLPFQIIFEDTLCLTVRHQVLRGRICVDFLEELI